MGKTNIALILVLGGLLAACEKNTVSAGPPEASFTGRLNGERVEILASIPAGHHAYLNAGDQGNLVPISFDWHATGLSPRQIEGPAGVRDDEVKAQVLRGEGTFVFTAPQAATLAGKTVRVQSQICDETQGICYRPATHEVVIQ